MTVKGLIIKLLEENMDTEVRLTIDDPHQDEHGDCSGYVFDIDSVTHEFGMCMIKFTDWRESKKILDEAIDGPGKDGNVKEWIENTRYNRRGKKFLDCPVCHYGENGDVICEVSKVPNYCPNCGERLILPVIKEGDKK